MGRTFSAIKESMKLKNNPFFTVVKEGKGIAIILSEQTWLRYSHTVNMCKSFEFYFPVLQTSRWIEKEELTDEFKNCAVGDIVECETIIYENKGSYDPKGPQVAINITRNITRGERIAKANKYYKMYLTQIKSTQKTQKEK